jgi:ferritin-like metal-binding protein YciE
MKAESMRDLYVLELRGLFDAEIRVIGALLKMAQAASAVELQSAFDGRLEDARRHVHRLELLFQQIHESPKGRKTKGMAGIISDGEGVVAESSPAAVRDAALLATARRMEHYEQAGYGAAAALALKLGFEDHAQVLRSSLQEDDEADRKLAALAERRASSAAGAARRQ